MNQAEMVTVVDKDGRRSTIEGPSNFPGGGETEVFVQLDNGQRVLIPTDMLVLQDDGSYYLPLSLTELQRQSKAGQGNEALVVPVMVEELDVQKRQVEAGGVRITKVVHEREEMVDEPLLKEELEVKRVPINRPVDGPIPVRYVGNTMIVSLLEEVLVVEKRLMLKEELHINTRQVERRQPQPVTLRSEEAIVEPIDNPSREEVTR
jgi:uncharacterized protein (TIGR02271 family)